MTKIAISSYDAASLAAARRAGESRKYIWDRIRAQFAIPADIKLGMATDRTLYVKDSNPRRFLIAGADGRFADNFTSMYNATVNQSDFDTEVRMVTTPSMFNGELNTGRFVTSTPAHHGRWHVISKADLLELFADTDPGEHANLPDGFPTGSDVVFDTTTGDLYWKA
jgi:hypothetical protein